VRLAVRVGLILAVVLAATPSGAQSKRYPPEPVDRDREAEQRSKLWESATNPKSHPYEQLVQEARHDIQARTPARLRSALEKLGEAIALLPRHHVAYALRGAVHLELGEWARCASDLEAAVDTGEHEGEAARPRALLDLRRSLGICLARAGRLADAERVLAEVAASGAGTGELLMRLGEVRIAMGKLDEAIAALQAALDATDLPSVPLARWLLASAYDRARRPSEASREARSAVAYDRNLSALVTQAVPLLGAGETEYLLGLAYATVEPPSVEKSLVYFRRFLAVAPESPWRRRAEEHLRELEGARLPETVARVNGMAALDLHAAATVVRRSMPAMRACMAKVPGAVMEVLITRSGPRSPRRTRTPYVVRHPYRTTAPPPDGVTVSLALSLDDTASRVELDAATRCIEPIASRIVLPAVNEKDSWYRIGFYVVSP